MTAHSSPLLHSAIRQSLRCPACRGRLVDDDEAFSCENSACVYATEPFPVVSGQPALIDSRQSIISTSSLSSHSGSSVIARKESLATRIGRLILAERPGNVSTLAQPATSLRWPKK